MKCKVFFFSEHPRNVTVPFFPENFYVNSLLPVLDKIACTKSKKDFESHVLLSVKQG